MRPSPPAARAPAQARPRFAFFTIGLVLRDRGEWEEAIAQFREAIRLDPDFGRARYNLGALLRGQGKLDEAIAQFRRAILGRARRPRPPPRLGLALYQQGHLDGAISEFREAIRLEPTAAARLFQLRQRAVRPGEAG